MAKLGKGLYSIKAISPDIIHKSENHAVILNLKSYEEIEKAWDSIISANKDAKIEGMLIQLMGGGKEVIIGMKRDPVFGPAIIFGLGGIFTEAFNDVSTRVAPIAHIEAIKMIGEIKGYKILQGIRGEKAVDIEALADLIEKFSKMCLDHPEIKEVDINPVQVTEEGLSIIDVRVMV
jgi:acyl-CoA synthetase (NDP forming)